MWNGVESVRWCYDERDLDGELCVAREIELYKLKRDYNELKEMLEVIEINDMKYLLYKIESENYFDDTCLNNNNLPYDEKITDLILNVTTVSYTHLDVYKRQLSICLNFYLCVSRIFLRALLNLLPSKSNLLYIDSVSNLFNFLLQLLSFYSYVIM